MYSIIALGGCILRTTLDIPDNLITEIARLSGKTKKTEIVISALQAYEKTLRTRKLLSMRGKSDLFADDFDPIAYRKLER